MTDSERTVLVVDDDRAFATLTATHLREALPGVDVEVRVDPRAAAESLGRADAVVSDHEMPAMTGIDLLCVARRRGGDLPFVLFTGCGSAAVREGADAAGATAYVRKHDRDAFDAVVRAVSASLETRVEATP
ncbi:response regulator (plasmid) [Halarchaeum sp. CBA1220]|uniref:response regulator n=1 Tax=Halarchaeum sp. CBA1220 TaxID=1853682 RepID=UPI000F3A928E|nr:response regulator [Halarchaeum sp. CBA1220]QLC34926.1 response regulator [Halarchaeum sp. CBA1220]